MKLVERSGTWQVHFQDLAGDRQRLSTGVRVNPAVPDRGKALATAAALEKMRAAMTLPAEAAVAGRAPTLAYVLRHTLDHHWETLKSSASLRYRVESIIKDRGYWRIDQITYNLLEEYGRELAKRGDAPATRNRKMSVIHTALVKAQQRGEIKTIPQFPRWREENLKERYLLPEEERKLLAWLEMNAAPSDEPRQYLLRLIPFLLDTGLRAGEVTLLTKELDRWQDKLWLPHGGTKSGKARSVPLTARAREALTWMLESDYHAELLRLRARSKELPSQHLGRLFRFAVSKSGIEGVTLHTLRHTCASRLVQAGISLYVVKEWLGHSSITVTERYAHLAPKAMDEALAALEAVQKVEAEGSRRDTSVTKPNVEGTVH